MTPQTEAALITALQEIALQLTGINQKLASLQKIPATLTNIAARTGR
jgi:hypothetical protein